MSSPTKAKETSDLAGLTPGETKHLLLANLCMTTTGKMDWELLATLTDTKAKSARWTHLRGRRKLENAYHEALAGTNSKGEAPDNQGDLKSQEKK
ncbi:hypothetical protein N7499_006925 [Penicillium canescens]|nr:hypothetical protein N7522_008416 [Penicillium canescens]KAJ6082051.1 hypothetical protein N7499_006925 [Penicillium canescens]KAJ6176153.1 hypothetical protein N7485_003067 [Penicillium canescens]